MIALALMTCVPIIMWAGQSLMLRHHGLPLRLRIDGGDAPRPVRTAGRIITQASLAAVILAYPPLLGEGITAYYGRLLPWDASWQLPCGLAASVLFLCVLYGVWVFTDQLLVRVHQKRRRWMRRLILLIPTALFGAIVEEFLFRAVFMADLLKLFDIETPLVTRESLFGTSSIAAIGVGASVFAAAHYIRKTKRQWTFPGHVALGILLCIAFITTGSLWLAIGLHAGGILVIMGTRPFIVYRGPGWLTGASIFPFAGIPGIIGLGILTLFVLRLNGVPLG